MVNVATITLTIIIAKVSKKPLSYPALLPETSKTSATQYGIKIGPTKPPILATEVDRQI